MWLEDPIETDDLDSLERVSSAGGVPVGTGERMVASHSFREVIERQLIDFVQPDCQNVGGMSRARDIGLHAESYYMRVALHHSGGPVALAMSAQVAACAPNLAMVEMPYPGRPWWNNVLKAPFEQRSGFLRVPPGPGLGVEYRAEFLDQA
jgi:galactonate dehydratase